MTGKDFQAWRNAAKLSLRDVKALTGVGFPSISRFENGHNITSKNYQALEALMKGEALDTTDDKQTKIRFHLKQLEILMESEG